jgi:geranylgeranylglycerol-phosphate geranylgeranyltransferase
MNRPGMPPTRARQGIEAVRIALRLMRIEKPLCSTSFAFLGAWLVAPLYMLWSARVFTAAACVGCITAFGFVINDCRDLAVDRIGRAERPLPAGRVTLPAAQSLAYGLAAAGLLLGLALGGVPALIAAGAVALSAGYSYRLKGTVVLGNLCVALLVSGVLVFGAVVAAGTTPAVWIAAAITFTFIAAQEILFTLEDEDVDRAAGLTTTATWLGTTRTALLAVFAVAGLVPWLAGIASNTYAAAFAGLSLGPAALLYAWLRVPPSPEHIARAARWSRLLWVTGFIPLSLLK